MPGLQIPPHSRRLSGRAVVFLSLLAAGSFVSGLNHQLITTHGASAFPAPSAGPAVASQAIPEARPAADTQRADAAPARRPARSESAPDPLAVPGAPDAQAAPAADTAATAPDPAPAAPPAPSDAPPTAL
jgi:hypothetical protein